MSLVAYLRQSRSSERSVSIDEQREAIDRWSLAHGESVVFGDRYIERNVSGAKPWQERELGAAIEMLKAGAASGIVVAYQDRLARPTWLQEAEVWEALAEADSRLVCAGEGTDFRPGDLEHSDARLLYRIKAATARHTWERHCRNWRKGKHSAWLRGVYVGPTPAGYERDGEGRLVQGEQAAVIREAFELKGRGGSAGEVAKLLTASGVCTYRGRSVWTRATAQSLLCNEVYTGLHPCTCACGESVHRPAWEILPRWLWRKAQPGRAEVSYSRGEGYVLGGGLCRCGYCGDGLVRSGSAKGRYRHLRCKGVGIGHVSISYPLAEDWILGAVFAHAVGWTVKRSGGNAVAIQAADGRLADARRQLAEVEELRGKIAPAAFGIAYSDALQEVEQVEEARAGLTLQAEEETLLTAYGSRLEFEKLPVPEQRRILGRVVRRAVILPGRQHVGRRIVIEFADGSWHPDYAGAAGQWHDWLKAHAPLELVEPQAGVHYPAG